MPWLTACLSLRGNGNPSNGPVPANGSIGILSRRLGAGRGWFELWAKTARGIRSDPPCALVARNCSPGYAFIPRSNNLPSHPDMEGRAMDSIIYLVGVVVVIMLVLSFLGLR